MSDALPVIEAPAGTFTMPPRINARVTAEWLVAFLQDELVERRGITQAVVGLSGGVDSAVTAFLCAKALGAQNVHAIRLPYKTSSGASLSDARLVVEALGIKERTIDISAAVDGYLQFEPDADARRRGNVMARVRMVALFDQSAKHNALPIGTGNKTERLLGYFTWHADDTPPVNPIGDLYKSQVWELARFLGVPSGLVDKAPSADLEADQTDEGDLGITYERADAVLAHMLEGYSNAQLVEHGFDRADVEAWCAGAWTERIGSATFRQRRCSRTRPSTSFICGRLISSVPSVEIVAVGTELLLGQLIDTNSAFVAQALAQAGLDVYGTHAVGDNRERIAAALGSALERADGVVTTGGLGPTVDDLTKESVCDLFGLDTVLDEPSLRAIEEIFNRTGREMRENNLKQAQLPRGAVVMHNANGTAPGFIAIRADGKFIASMPGVPSEMKPMLAEHRSLAAGTLRVARGDLYARLARDQHRRIGDRSPHRRSVSNLENPKIAVLAHDYRCDVKIMAKAASKEAAQELIAPVEFDILKRLAGHVFGVDGQTLAGAVLTLLAHTEHTVALAESCTGGLLSAAFTAVPGSSRSFMGGITAYDNYVKEHVLGVQTQTLVRYGAVSEECVREMAEGACKTMRATVGLATTGVAGPSGGTPDKPVGLVWIGVATPKGTRAYSLHLRGERSLIQARATTAALGFLWRGLAREETF